MKSDFRLTEDNAWDTLYICRQLDGIPLAIELAAARVTALTPAQIAARLENRVPLLSTMSLAFAEGDYVRAQALWESSLEKDRALDYRWGMAASLASLGTVACYRDDPVAARKLFREGLTLALEVGDNGLIVLVAEEVAKLMLNEGDAAFAARLMGSVQRLRQVMGASLPPDLQQKYEAHLTRIRQALGAERYEIFHAEGVAMDREHLLQALFVELQE